MRNVTQRAPRPALTLVPAAPAPGTRWSAADDAVLRAEYGHRTAVELAAQLGRGVDATRQRARVLGLATPVKARIIWTAAADAELRADYRRVSTDELAARLGTTIDAIWARAKLLGLARTGCSVPWTADEDRLMRDLYGAEALAAIAATLGRSVAAVKNRVRTLGLTRETNVAQRRARDQAEIRRLQAETEQLRAAAPMSDDARRFAVLLAYRMSVIMPDETAVVLGVPVSRLPVELGKAAKRGLDVLSDTLGGR